MSEGSYGAHDGVSYGTLDDYHAHSDLAEASAALDAVLFGDTRINNPHLAHELLGRLTVIAPDAVIEAIESARQWNAAKEASVI